MGVRALLKEPALALELRDHRLIRLVEEAEPIEPSDAGHSTAAQCEQGDHELAQHAAWYKTGLRKGSIANAPYYYHYSSARAACRLV